ncbi:MAG: Stk1 family PASTA domain-containing Ser/Thr kinase [Dorea sp.]|nr:Stk1 family PASTA domain-containing Ser/Thr kinase [Dorea sp.]
MVNGVMLGKRYNILSKIGVGGMADVYRAKDIMLNRYVAVKVLKKEYRTDENFVRKFRSEAQAAAGLLHPNIVNVYDVGEDRGLNYMVQELVEGITLKEYIRKKGRLSSNEVISIAIQMCSGIGAAHAAGIIHRDIKPQNIMISKDGKVKVTDFGIAKAITSQTVSSNAMGSVHYTSPEQCRGGFSDQKSDIYSIGITLYEMITGKVPFDGETTVEVALKHLQKEITPPSELVPDIPYSLEQIILKCTQKASEKRYANTADLVKDLKRTLVDPDGHFVVLDPASASSTMVMSETELNKIRNNYGQGGKSKRKYTDDDDEDYEEFESDDDIQNARRKEPEINDGMSRLMKILMIVIAVMILCIGGFALAKAFGSFELGGLVEEQGPEQVKVPDLLGMTEEEAKEELNKLGLGYHVKAREESDRYKKGQIMDQSIEAGTKVDKNTKVDVVVSTGLADEEKKVPNVEGFKEDEAQKILQDAGFKVRAEFEYSDTVEEGKVIKTDPEAGEMLKKSATVTMIVSKGVEKNTVPRIIGMEEYEAQNEIVNSGLSVGYATYEYSDTVPEGHVISQDPTPGSKVEAGTVVYYTVSIGKEPPQQVPVPPVTGSSLSNAKTLINSAGLYVGDVSYEYSEYVDSGIVISCSPGEGSYVDEKTNVSIVVSKGPDPALSTPTDTPATE